MAWPVYSERFMLITTPGVWEAWYVPAGRRAVIKAVLCSGNLGVQGVFQLAIGTSLVYTVLVPVAEGSRSMVTSTVLYAGERLQGQVGSLGDTLTISGYLLDAPLLRQGPPALEAGEAPDPWPRPPSPPPT